jgi:hypothetical protein
MEPKGGDWSLDSQSNSSATTHSTDPVDHLLEARQVIWDFQGADGTVRVETRIKLQRRPWSFLSTVQEDGVEIETGPLAPVRKDLDPTDLEPEWVEDTKRDFAGQALAVHAERCRQVERALAGPERTGGPKRHGVVIAVVLVVVAAVLGGVAFHLSRQKQGTGGADGAPAATGLAAAGAEILPPTLLPPDGQAAEAEPDEGSSWTIAPPTFPADAGADLEPPPRPRRTSGDSSPPPRRAPSKPLERREAAAAPTPPAPVPATAATEEESSAADTGLGAVSSASLILDLQPSRYRLVALQPGQAAYIDHGARLAGVPTARVGCSSVQTAFADRDQLVSLSFVLAQPARVYVAHDQRLRKKPDWLRNFARTGESWQVSGVDETGAMSDFDVYVRDYPAGLVDLGANTNWSPTTRILRDVIPKNVAMYLVCVDPA